MRLSVCASCEGRGAEGAVLVALREAAAGTGIEVVAGPCLGPCGQGVRVALTGAGRFGWLFEGLDAAADMAAFTRFLAEWVRAPDGLVAKRDRILLMARTVGRVPPV